MAKKSEKTALKALYLMDKWILLTYVLLVVIGFINIYSTSQSVGSTERQIAFFQSLHGKQLIFIGISLLCSFVIINLNSLNIVSLSPIAYGFSIVLLVAVIFFGKKVSGNQSWISVGFFNIQPSELAKFGTALLLSSYLSSFRHVEKVSFFKKKWAFPILFLPIILVMLQPDFGSALVFTAFFFVFYLEGLPAYYLIIICILAVVAVIYLLFSQLITLGVILAVVAIIYMIRKRLQINSLLIFISAAICIGFVFVVDFVYYNLLGAHHRDRIEILLGIKTDLKGTGYNLNQSMISIGSGGFLGKGFLKGTQTKLDFVPEQRTDFIFCTIAEEWGFLGSLFVLGLYLFLIIRLLVIADYQTMHFSKIYICCVACILFIHLFINIGMTIGIVPIIGIPLPFISYGGSSLLSFSLMLFTALALDARKTKSISF